MITFNNGVNYYSNLQCQSQPAFVMPENFDLLSGSGGSKFGLNSWHLPCQVSLSDGSTLL